MMCFVEYVFLHLVYGTLGICLIVCELSDVYVRTYVRNYHSCSSLFLFV